MVKTYAIGGPSLFPIIMDFLAHAIATEAGRSVSAVNSTPEVKK